MTNPEPISIWQPGVVDGRAVFQRPGLHPFGDHYADRLQLNPKRPGDPARICFFGESAAAGYLLARHVTPAKALQAHLRHLLPEDTPDVIDLARTNERLASLVETVKRSFQLSPDLLIIYAGNNWNLLETPELSPYFPSERGKQQMAEALLAGGLDALAELALRERLARAWRALSEIAEVARANSTPVVLVVPEVNLADWETLQPAPWLPGDGLERWYALLEDAKRSLHGGHYAAASGAALAMLDLDDGVSPTPYRLLAQARAGQGDWPAARAAAEAEVVSGHYPTMCFLGAPQASSAEQRLLRHAAQIFGFATVDLPRLFAGDGADALPGRRLFMDYCHLTVEGVHQAAAGMAAAALEALRHGTTPDVAALIRDLPRPVISPEHLAVAELGAAIHTAHRLADFLRKDELVRHWLERALDTSPGIAQTFLEVVAARSVDLPALFTAAQQSNLASPYTLQLQHGWRYDHIDACLVQAIIDVLARRDPELAKRATRSLLERAPSSADLVEQRTLWEPLMQAYPDLLPTRDRHGCAFLRAAWPRVSFAWIASGETDLILDITARLPQRVQGRAEVFVNGQHAGGLALTTRWSRSVFPIPAPLLRSGLNRITFQFPPPDPRDDVWSAVAGRLAQGLEADLFPVFGELFSVRVME